ncbi:MAG: YdeI/OmpD-associated family protein [Chloroflexota bacterium]|nr:YdeI/OmpD-associated family protein [Chloroflexota bacterium]
MTTFTTTIIQAEGKNATGIRVPAEIIADLGAGKKPRVKVTLNGYTYSITVAAFGAVFMLALSAEHRNAAGVKAGDELAVTIELDTEPRTVDVPDDLAAALAAESGARAAFDALSHTMRKEYVRHVLDAKAEATRIRRIATIVGKLATP